MEREEISEFCGEIGYVYISWLKNNDVAFQNKNKSHATCVIHRKSH